MTWRRGLISRQSKLITTKRLKLPFTVREVTLLIMSDKRRVLVYNHLQYRRQRVTYFKQKTRRYI